MTASAARREARDVTRLALLLAAALALAGAAARAEPPLALETKIPLGDVYGRIDHMAFDAGRQRLFVAELGNDSVAVVDLRQGKLLRRLARLREPQGVGYEPSTDTLFVASAVDGDVHLFQGANLSPGPVIALGKDADNIRVDAKTATVFIGYGTGAIAVVDAARRAKVAELPLREHPEGFQLDPGGTRIFVNVPDAREIAVLDRAAGKSVATWPVRDARANFPMALEEEGKRVIAVFRRPARLIAFGAEDGKIAAALDTCSDADDVFVDAPRRRLYVSCGEGVVDVIERRGADYARLATVPTVAGARTSFFIPETDRLYVAARATVGEPAALWVFRPTP
jgi:DNA-binding beta-propeller fold protein YncE